MKQIGRKYYNKRPRRPKKEKDVNMKKCPHCGNRMRARGAGNTVGSRFYKCRNKKCGRTVWERTYPKEVIPITYVRR